MAAFAGCPQSATTPTSQSQQDVLRRAERSDALLKNAAGMLADLPSAVDTELRPPAVILDSTKSADGKDVLAICAANPGIPGGPINVLHVPSGNGRFRSLGVRSGDLLKYYIREDETVDEESRLAGLSRQLALDLTVAQVLDDSTLLVEGGLSAPVPFPMKIEVWRYLDDRLKDINERLVLYTTYRRPALGWQPSPDEQVLTQIVTWLNQWLRQGAPKIDWQRDPLLDRLDATLLSDKELVPYISATALGASSFEPHDGQLLQEAVWLRDISRWAQGDNFNDLARATALFDWTVRNIQLVEDGVSHRPWQVLLYGRGTAEQRAWVFAMLCRQQGLDVVMLGVPAPSHNESETGSPAAASTVWLPALVLDKDIYLFDARLGLPIPGPGGEGVATLAQVQQDGAVLRQLDLADSPYLLTADAFKDAVANVVADAFDLSRRAAQLESKLTGDDHLVLTSAASQLAEQLKTAPGIADVRLWQLPFRTLREQLTLGKTARQREAIAFEPFAVRPLYWKARVRHFQGRRQADDSVHDEVDDHREAAGLYTDPAVRPKNRDIVQTTSAEKRRVDSMAKLNATYWVGLLSFDKGKYEVAKHWLSRPELMVAESPWSGGARYNLARAHEALGELEQAIQLLEEDTSPQRHGNRLRARQLKAQHEAVSGNN
jgi:hypothetical protein